MKNVICIVLLVIVTGWPAAANAHHIMGIPHYKYGEDYPQLPYAEVKAQVGNFDLHFTYFPGTPKPGERVRFKLYVLNRDTGEPFREPLEVVYASERLFRSDEQLAPARQIRVGDGPEGNDYKFFHVFEDADAFLVKVRFPYQGTVEVLPFPVQIGVTDTRPLLGGAVVTLFLSVGVVAMLKRREKRTRRRKPR